MGTHPNHPDKAIDKVLAALNHAVPPEGLEARIAQRLQQQPAPAPSWRDRLIGFTLAAAWWRGAATGAAFALLAVAAFLVFQHKTPTPNHIAISVNAPAPAAVPVKAGESAANPCAHPAVLLRAQTPTAAPAAETDSSHPVPNGPLTTQERELVRLAQTADPRTLATLNSVHQAQLEAENAEQFDKFFTPPPRPPLPPDNPAANPQPDQPANLEVTPAANPQASPAANPETSPEAKPESDSPANPEAAPSLTPPVAPATSN